MNSQTATRRGRIEWITIALAKVKEAGGKREFDKDHFISQVMIKYGISRRLAREDVSAVMDVRW